MVFLRFVLGLAFGSFLNVVALRYDPDKFLFARAVIGGRSHCPHCYRTLRWFELVPLASFLALGGRCRTCRSKLTWQYFFAELLSACVVAFVPYGVSAFALSRLDYLALCAAWIAAAEILLLMSLIDIRLKLIPDEIHLMLVALAAVRVTLEQRFFAAGAGSFVSRYALLFGIAGNMWVNHIVAAFAGALFFLFLILVTRGRGMGVGDAKLALALGLLFGWPDILFIVMLAFILGALFGLWKIVLERGKLKSSVPFGPFLALAAVILFFWGNAILGWYFSLFGIVP